MPAKNRIDHFTWLVEPENLPRYVKQMSELFETTFDEVFNESAGVRALISWDAGLEFAAPYGDLPAADALRAVLAERGEGPFAIVVRVPSIDASSERAAALGWPIDRQLLELEAGVSSTTKVTSARERVIGSFLNTSLLFGEIEYADVEDATRP
ncbi:hypothetical protein [Nocardia transvalensis]|uniref:hypothetical protein n=1 Tax=Nocardia transvalensis TaxID=37333 RepID=UPI0018957224|nr:hypothetical protein [Nocardia transvalensis]MBF6334104.1 hypothetical protein [Nocardia transvalensis]